jgi:hypothetical protein
LSFKVKLSGPSADSTNVLTVKNHWEFILITFVSIIFAWLLPLNAQECFNEDCAGVGSFENSPIGRSILQGSDSGLAAALKTQDELDEYFNCHIATGVGETEQRRRQAHLQEYRTLYRPMIELAAQHFQMPYAMTACVMFRESRFNREAVSDIGARGIAQFTEATYNRMRRDMANVRRIERDYQEYVRQGMDYEALIRYQGRDNRYIVLQQFAQREGALYNQASEAERQRSRELARTQLGGHSRYKPILDSMTSYLYDVSRHYGLSTATEDQQRRRRQMFPNTPMGQFPQGDDLIPPSSFNQMLNEPAWVVAMNMFYLRQQLADVNSRVDMRSFDSGQDMIGFLATIGAGYNRGNADLNEAASDLPSVRAWCQQMATYPETRDYMLSLRRCMTRNSFDPPANQGANSRCQNEVTPASDDPCAPPGGAATSTPTGAPLAPTVSPRPARNPRVQQ